MLDSQQIKFLHEAGKIPTLEVEDFFSIFD